MVDYDDEEYRRRSGPGIQWRQVEKTCLGVKELRGFTVDNLDTKNILEARNNYEEVFIRVRTTLEQKPWCCDSREDVLNICQVVADCLKENLLIRKDEK